MDSAYFEPIIAGGATKDVEETEAILRVDSLEVQQLQPWVRDLHAATAALKAAFESSEVAGEARRAQLQNAYIKAAGRLCEETVARCPNLWWPQLFIVAYRAPHPGRVNPLVDPRAVRMAFEGKIDPEVLRTIVDQATYVRTRDLSRSKNQVGLASCNGQGPHTGSLACSVDGCGLQQHQPVRTVVRQTYEFGRDGRISVADCREEVYCHGKGPAKQNPSDCTLVV